MKIYLNALGTPEPNASIAMWGDITKNKHRWRLLTIIDNLGDDLIGKKWPPETDPQEIVEEMASQGWECEIEYGIDVYPRISCVHTATQLYEDEKRKEAEEKYKDAEKIYIRFGDLPPNGKSMDHRDKIYEAGVSVFEAELAKDGSYRIIPTNYNQVETLHGVKHRKAYRIFGEVVGKGGDGEPVVVVESVVEL